MRDINTAALIVFIAMAILAGVGKPLSDRVRRRREAQHHCHTRLRRPRVRAYRAGAELRHWASSGGARPVPRLAIGRDRYHASPGDPYPPVTIGAWLLAGPLCVSLQWAELERVNHVKSAADRREARRRRKEDRERRQVSRELDQEARRRRRQERKERRHDR